MIPMRGAERDYQLALAEEAEHEWIVDQLRRAGWERCRAGWERWEAVEEADRLMAERVKRRQR